MANTNEHEIQHDFHIEDGILKAYTGRDPFITIPQQVHTIGEGALKACVSLKKVVLPSGLRRILAGAFKGCRKLQTIEIPDGVTYVGDYAFHRCHSLEQIALPPSVTELGDCVFLYCDSLARVCMPGVTRLGKQVFVNDVMLKELVVSPKLEETCLCDVFTGCSRIGDIAFSDGQRYVIPNAVEAVAGSMELPSLVRAIAVDILRMMELDGRCLVRFLTNLKHVEIPEGIETIGKSCFFDKRGIISVTFPSSLKEIGSRAFRNCIGLETVVFRQTQVLIHEDAFKNCSSLKEIHTPHGASYVMEGICGLSGEIPPLVKTIHQQILGNFLLSGSILLKYLGSESRVVVPRGVTVIAQEAFADNEAVERVILPDTLEEIGAGAFRDCLLLQTIEFPFGLKHIRPGAFENCVKLLRALLPDSLVRVEDKVFKHCRLLKGAVLGAGIRAIGEQAFYGCLALKEMLFPESLTSLGKMAFFRCRALGEVSLPSGLEQAGNLAFAQSGVRKVRMAGSGRRYGTDIFSGCTRLRVLTLEQGVRHIPDKLAYGCTALKQVFLPDTLESVGRTVWEHTPFLTQWKQGWDQDRTCGAVFWDGRDIQGSFRVPEGTRIVAGGAFYGNTALTEISFPHSVTWIGPAALKGCSGLCRVSWPAAVTMAAPEVFSGCARLSDVSTGDWPDVSAPFHTSVFWQHIGERAFYNCKVLSHISLDRVLFIGKEAFMGCVSFRPQKADLLQQVGENAFEHIQELENEPAFSVIGTILVSGRNLKGQVQVPEGITAIGPYAFSRNGSITHLYLPESLRHIGEGAFWGCGSLKHVDFPPFLDTVGPRAFEKCPELTQVRLRAGMVGSAAFAYCVSLRQAVLDGTQVLCSRLFEGCGNLRQCVCKDSQVLEPYCFSGCRQLEAFDLHGVKEIGSYGFQNCDSLTQAAFDDHTIIRPHAFEDCGRLRSVSLIGSQGQARLCEYAFSGCTALNQVVCQGQTWEWEDYKDIITGSMPEMARLIFHSAFSCFDIRQGEILCRYRGLGHMVAVPRGIRRIEAEVFRDVLMLEEVTIPDTVEYIGSRAFHGAAWLERQRQISPMVVVNHMLLDGSFCTGEVVVPKDIRLVCGWAFAGGLGIEKIRFLSDSVKVDPYAFRNCIYLKELVLGNNLTVVFQGIGDRKRELPPLAMQAVMDSLNCFKTDEQDVLVECTGNISRLLVADGIKGIGDGAFQDGNLLTLITLPLSVTSIGNHSFAGCKWLKQVQNAYGVTVIGDRAFSGCGILEEIQLSSQLSHIGVRAFENCVSLREILLPEGLTEIPDRAFFRCHNLKSVQLPSTLTRIGREAFAFCKNLKMPQIPEGVLVGERAFEGVL